MKRLVFSKPVTRWLTPGSNDYTNLNTNPTRPSRRLTWPGGRSRWGKLLGGVHRGKSPASFNYVSIHAYSELKKYFTSATQIWPELSPWQRRLTIIQLTFPVRNLQRTICSLA